MKPHGFMNTSLPKFTVPQVSEHASGRASSTASRRSKLSVTAPPVDSCTIRSVAARSASTVSVSLPGSKVGRAASSLMCTWITAAPASRHSFAVVTSSSSVTGRAGTADFSDSAPVGATVISVALAALVLVGVVSAVISGYVPFLRRAAAGYRAVYAAPFPPKCPVTRLPGCGSRPATMPGVPECGLVRAVVQRASTASVTVDGQLTGQLEGPGLVVLLG